MAVEREWSAGLPRLLGLGLLLALAGCGGRGQGGVAWDGHRGYDGHGDYGYDPAAPAEAQAYLTRAARTYPQPGPPGDPWGPYIAEAASRHGIPQAWIRAVMQQESGGQLQAADGSLITSGAGAMGLMQVMPQTWESLRAREGLGADPYEPHDNILAGAAYLRAMYDRFGAPAFLAAYNAGPDRVDAFLSGAAILPEETVDYVAAIGPAIGMPGSLRGGPVAGSVAAYTGGGTDDKNAAYEGGGAVGSDAAYAGGGMRGSDYYGTGR